MPPSSVCERLKEELFSAVDQGERDVARGVIDLERLQAAWDTHVGPWLYRSELFWRSRFKPHGYAGDVSIIEAMYDLEESLGQSEQKSALQNALDYCFAHVHRVRGLWDRRRFMRSVVERAAGGREAPLRVLDVACGGARYLRDLLDRPQGRAPTRSLTLVDQDPVALDLCARRFEDVRISRWCEPIQRADPVWEANPQDVILSAGLFDYLDDAAARKLLASLAESLAPGGTLAISNYHPHDRAAFFRAAVVQWPLVLRDEPAVASLFPSQLTVHTGRSPDGSLTYGVATR